jgi:serine protease Do
VPAGGDVILAIDEQSVRKFDDLLSYLTDNTRAGQAVTLSILRDGQQQTVKVVLDTRPAAASNQP